MKRIIVILIVLLFSLATEAQESVKVYPTHWWTGMKHNSITLLFRSTDKNIASAKIAGSSSSPFIKVKKVTAMENPHYVQMQIEIAPQAKAGNYTLSFGGVVKSEWTRVNFELKQRSTENGKTRVQGVNSTDLTYLLMPDRFANGDPSNDAFPELMDKKADRTNKFARHGGDLKGVMDHLDYFKELGVTTLWFTPVTENDMPLMREGSWDMAGYHGYWFTDHYKVDKRFGGNEGYKQMVAAAHQKGLKIIQDAIYNHIGLYHWIYQDAPAKDWINNWPSFTGPNHREETLMDPYASQYDKVNMVKGWFTPHLPDLNLAHPDLAIFLIQHAIWSVEEFGFDGFRIDTYKYCDENFLNNMNEALVKEYPKLTTFVEAWANTTVANAYYVQNNFNIKFKHNAPGAIDFSLCFAMLAGMNQSPGWTDGVNKIYMTLAQDFIYKNPMNNCIFLDNHDMDRAFSVAGEDWNRYKWGLNWLMTMRGIPQLFYGTEILMKNYKNPTDAEVRYDFPGGWAGDAVNKFTAAGRTAKENEAFDYISKLAHFRKSSSAITSGKTMQYIVRDGFYIYFRYDAKQTVMVVTNSGKNNVKPDWTVYSERVAGFTKARNVITNEVVDLNSMEWKGGQAGVYELLK